MEKSFGKNKPDSVEWIEEGIQQKEENMIHKKKTQKPNEWNETK